MQKYYFFQEQQFFAIKNSRPAVIPIFSPAEKADKKDFPFHQG